MTADTTTLLEQAGQLLDTHRVALDKTPTTPPNPDLVRDTAALINTIRDLADDVAESLIPHLKGVDSREQWTLTGGWVLYDRDSPSTWPPSEVPIMIRQYDRGPDGQRGRYRDQRRGVYEHGRLTWRVRGFRPLAGVQVPVPDALTYAWRLAQ